MLLADPFPTDAELADFQAAHEAGMRDSCTVKRQTGTTTDPNTGAEVPTYTAVYGTDLEPGICRVKMAGASTGGAGSDRSVGEQPVITTTFVLSVPVSAVGIVENDVATITASLDPDLVGRTLRIDSPWGQTHATARRFACEESTLP